MATGPQNRLARHHRSYQTQKEIRHALFGKTTPGWPNGCVPAWCSRRARHAHHPTRPPHVTSTGPTHTAVARDISVSSETPRDTQRSRPGPGERAPRRADRAGDLAQQRGCLPPNTPPGRPPTATPPESLSTRLATAQPPKERDWLTATALLVLCGCEVPRLTRS